MKLRYFLLKFLKEFIDKKYRTSIDLSIDNAIQSCPIDTRRKLYEVCYK